MILEKITRLKYQVMYKKLDIFDLLNLLDKEQSPHVSLSTIFHKMVTLIELYY